MISFALEVNFNTFLLYNMRIEKQPYCLQIKDHDTSVNNFRKHEKLFEGIAKEG